MPETRTTSSFAENRNSSDSEHDEVPISKEESELLRARFIDLEMAMVSGDLSAASWEGYRQRRLAIERDEPPIYRALDLLCHNEVCQAEGFTRARHTEQFAKVGFLQGLTSNVLHWPNITPAG